jgi:hypothetical protein
MENPFLYFIDFLNEIAEWIKELGEKIVNIFLR